MKLSIIIPAFNEEKTITQVIDRLQKLKIPDVEKEIIIVDDGSTDASAAVISNYKFPTSNYKFIKHKKNLGKGAAVITGIKNATGDYITIQDADLEYDPSYFVSLFVPIKKGQAQVVYGTRLKRLPHLLKEEKKGLFLLHYIGNRSLSLITSVLYGQWITDMETCYKIFPREAVMHMKLNARGFEFEPEITAKLLKKKFKIVELPISTVPRGYDEGKKLHTVRDGLKALWAILKYRFVN
ncbi:MAG TPA: glycosyltransferase family 2 protein [Candidatus Saccharimonadales bacterium]|nr:glycosyltransferase family 2 protein [Candidatus Saccharimonadales bacterium]